MVGDNLKGFAGVVKETTSVRSLHPHWNGLSISKGTLKGMEGNYFLVPSLSLLCKTLSL
jgi:hypothetical protein